MIGSVCREQMLYGDRLIDVGSCALKFVQATSELLSLELSRKISSCCVTAFERLKSTL